MGARYLIDTSAYSYFLTKRLTAEAYHFFEEIVREESILSVISRMELLSWLPGNKGLEADIRTILSNSTVLALTEPVILQTVRLRRHYKGLKLPDAIIAATAITNDFTLLSTNDVDFERITDLKYKSLSR